MNTYKEQLQQFEAGTFRPPTVSYGDSQIDFFHYLLSVSIAGFRLAKLGAKQRTFDPKRTTQYFELKGKAYDERIEELKVLLKERKEKLYGN